MVKAKVGIACVRRDSARGTAVLEFDGRRFVPSGER
jgi:hypothetical protein